MGARMCSAKLDDVLKEIRELRDNLNLAIDDAESAAKETGDADVAIDAAAKMQEVSEELSHAIEQYADITEGYH